MDIEKYHEEQLQEKQHPSFHLRRQQNAYGGIWVEASTKLEFAAAATDEGSGSISDILSSASYLAQCGLGGEWPTSSFYTLSVRNLCCAAAIWVRRWPFRPLYPYASQLALIRVRY